MKNYTNYIIVAIVILVITAIINMKKPAEEVAVNDSTIKVGVLLPLTGDATVYGEPGRNTYQLAVDEINKAGGINGQNIELIIEDSKCDGRAAADATQKLVNVDKVQSILGGFCSSESLAAVPIVTAAKVALLSPASSSPDLTNVSPFFFRNFPSDSSQGKILAQIAYNDKNWRNVAFVQEQTDYAVGIYRAFDEEFRKLGGTTSNENFATDTVDFRSIITKLKAAKPDALFIDAQAPAVAVRIIQQVEQSQWKPNVIINDGIAGDPDFLKNNSKFLEGTLTAEFGVDSANPKFQHLISAYTEKYGVEPAYQSYVQTIYDATYILKDALVAVGNDGQKIVDWSRAINSWDGASGKITILPSGDRDGGHVPRVVRDGKTQSYIK